MSDNSKRFKNYKSYYVDAFGMSIYLVYGISGMSVYDYLVSEQEESLFYERFILTCIGNIEISLTK